MYLFKEELTEEKQGYWFSNDTLGQPKQGHSNDDGTA